MLLGEATDSPGCPVHPEGGSHPPVASEIPYEPGFQAALCSTVIGDTNPEITR